MYSYKKKKLHSSGSSKRSRLVCWFFRALLIIPLFCSHAMLWTYLYITFILLQFDILNVLLCGAQLLVTLSIYDLLFRWKRLLILKRKISGCSHVFDGRITKLCKIICMGSMVLLILPLVSEILTCDLQTFVMFRSFTLNTMDFDVFSPATLRLFASVEVLVTLFGYYVPVYGVPTAVACLAFVLAGLYQHINAQLKEQLSNGVFQKFADISAIQKKYSEARAMVVEVDKLFSSSLLLWFMTSLSVVCSGLTYILKDHARFLPVTYVTATALFFVPFMYLMFLCFCASRIPIAVIEGYLLVRDIPFPCTLEKHFFYGKLLVLMNHLSSPPTGLTLGGVFLVTLSTVVSSIGCIITYLVVLLQLYPNLMAQLRVED